MGYVLALYNSIDGEIEIPLIAFTLRKRINEDTLLETQGTMTIPSGESESVINYSIELIRIYENAILIHQAAFISLTQEADTATLKSISLAALPAPVTIENNKVYAAVVSEGYSRVRGPVKFSINPGDTVITNYLTLVAKKTVSRISLQESFTEIIDNAAG